jgi:hypothetical protein
MCMEDYLEDIDNHEQNDEYDQYLQYEWEKHQEDIRDDQIFENN